MIPSQVVQAVEDKEILRLRIILKNSLMLDTSYKQFDEMLAFVKKHLPEIIQAHDGKEFLAKENWTDSYDTKLKGHLVNNFSHERIEHAKEVQSYLYDRNHEVKIEIEDKQNYNYKNSGSSSYKAGNNSESSNNEDTKYIKPDNKSLVTMITSLGVAGASIIFGLLFDMTITTIIIGTIIASAIVGGITYYLIKR